MKDERSPLPPSADDLDEEVRAADDTGMVAQQQEINAEETTIPLDQDKEHGLKGEE